MTGRRRARGSLLVAAAASGWGTWPLFLRGAQRYGAVPPALEAAVAMIGLTVGSAVVLGRDQVHATRTARHWLMIALLGVTDALNVVFFFAAYQRTSVAIAVLTHYLAPMLVALAAPLVVGEPSRTRTFVAAGVSLGGLVLLLAPWSAARTSGDTIGGAFGLASAVCYACNVLVSKSLVPVFSGSQVSLFHGLVSVVLLALLVPPYAWGRINGHAWLWLSAGAALPGATAGLFFVWGLRTIDASHASNLTLLEPLVATLAASFAMGERLSLPALAGGGLILVGAAVAVTQPHESTAPSESDVRGATRPRNRS